MIRGLLLAALGFSLVGGSAQADARPGAIDGTPRFDLSQVRRPRRFGPQSAEAV